MNHTIRKSHPDLKRKFLSRAFVLGALLTVNLLGCGDPEYYLSFDPLPGTYATTQSITIVPNDINVDRWWYTTDLSVPDEGHRCNEDGYNGAPIAINANTFIRVKTATPTGKISFYDAHYFIENPTYGVSEIELLEAALAFEGLSLSALAFGVEGHCDNYDELADTGLFRATIGESDIVMNYLDCLYQGISYDGQITLTETTKPGASFESQGSLTLGGLYNGTLIESGFRREGSEFSYFLDGASFTVSCSDVGCTGEDTMIKIRNDMYFPIEPAQCNVVP